MFIKIMHLQSPIKIKSHSSFSLAGKNEILPKLCNPFHVSRPSINRVSTVEVGGAQLR